LLVPYITNQWQNQQRELEFQRQNHEKELELKTNLATNVSEAPSRIVAAAMLYASGRLTEGTFIQDLTGWVSSSAIIEARLQGYYANSSIAERWEKYSDIMLPFLRLPGNAGNSTARGELVDEIKEYFESVGKPEVVYWDGLKSSPVSREPYRSSWLQLILAILDEKDDIVEAIVVNDVRSLG
jgi:hypothetical protein